VPRTYSEKFIRHLYNQPDSLGVRLGKVLVQGNLPALWVAEVLKVSRMTLHAWVRGGLKIRYNNANVLEKFLKLVEADLEIKLLPRANVRDSRAYLEKVATRMTRYEPACIGGATHMTRLRIGDTEKLLTEFRVQGNSQENTNDNRDSFIIADGKRMARNVLRSCFFAALDGEWDVNVRIQGGLVYKYLIRAGFDILVLDMSAMKDAATHLQHELSDLGVWISNLKGREKLHLERSIMKVALAIPQSFTTRDVDAFHKEALALCERLKQIRSVTVTAAYLPTLTALMGKLDQICKQCEHFLSRWGLELEARPPFEQEDICWNVSWALQDSQEIPELSPNIFAIENLRFWAEDTGQMLLDSIDEQFSLYAKRGKKSIELSFVKTEAEVPEENPSWALYLGGDEIFEVFRATPPVREILRMLAERGFRASPLKFDEKSDYRFAIQLKA